MYRVLDAMPCSLDKAQLADDLRLTPTERVEKVRAMGLFAEEAERSRRDRLR